MRKGSKMTLALFLSLPREKQSEIETIVCAAVRKYMIDASNTVAVRKTQIETKCSLPLVRYCIRQDEELKKEGRRRTIQASRSLTAFYLDKIGVDILPGAANVS